MNSLIPAEARFLTLGSKGVGKSGRGNVLSLNPLERRNDTGLFERSGVSCYTVLSFREHKRFISHESAASGFNVN